MEQGSNTSMLTCSTTQTLMTMKLQMKSDGFHSRSPLGPSIARESIQVSPAAILNSVMNARLNLPNCSGATSEKSDTPRMASAGASGVNRAAQRKCEGLRSSALTDAKHDDKYDERVHHRKQRGGNCRKHLC
jgi:hypothetical protein